MNDERWVSVGKAARTLGVNPRTINRWCQHGRVRCVRTAGGHFRIAQSTVDSMFAALIRQRQARSA